MLRECKLKMTYKEYMACVDEKTAAMTETSESEQDNINMRKIKNWLLFLEKSNDKRDLELLEDAQVYEK